jgi:hypothetical protein
MRPAPTVQSAGGRHRDSRGTGIVWAQMNDLGRSVYVVGVVAHNRAGRRLFFEGPAGARGRSAVRTVAQIATRLSNGPDDLDRLCARVTAIAAEYEMRRIAH